MLTKAVRTMLLSGLLGPVILFQQSCIDPDVYLRSFLLAFNNTLSFALDNAVVAFR